MERVVEAAYWQLTVRSDFSAAHALRHYQGKCENLHGHNYHVEMVIEGRKTSEDVEVLLDFTVLKRLLKQATSSLDHKNINEVAPFDKINPSAENISRYLFHIVRELLEDEVKNLDYAKDTKLYSLSVSEKDAQTATYREIYHNSIR